MLIREKMLSTGLFEENIFFNKYCDLIEQNETTKKQRYKTQKHHIIPVVVYKIFNMDGVNKADNLVNLLYKDHILAHYYLALCAKQETFRYKMTIAIQFILGKAKQVKNNVEELKQYVSKLDEYQQLYEESKKYCGDLFRGTTHETSQETKNKIGKANKGRVYVHKDGVVRSLKTEDVEFFTENGWTLGNPNCFKRNTRKGSIVINKDGIEKYIDKNELDAYIINGWVPGRTLEHARASARGTQQFYNNLSKEERVKKYASRAGQHWVMSEECKNKIRQANTGRKLTEEQKIQNGLRKKGTIHMTNGITDVMIHPERAQEFIALGYYRGRSKNRKKARGGNSL